MPLLQAVSPLAAASAEREAAVVETSHQAPSKKTQVETRVTLIVALLLALVLRARTSGQTQLPGGA
jgi:hypothetical protein